jgi:uncharacterized membrane protein YidH (DUF202 family)
MLVALLCAGGCLLQIRGLLEDQGALISDTSSMVHASKRVRRLVGLVAICAGAGLLVAGLWSWGQSSAGSDRLLTRAVVVGGALWLLIGLAIALSRGRDDA